MRLPLEAVLPHLPAILEGVLLWAADSKNKFKLKVRSSKCDQEHKHWRVHMSHHFLVSSLPCQPPKSSQRVDFCLRHDADI